MSAERKLRKSIRSKSLTDCVNVTASIRNENIKLHIQLNEIHDFIRYVTVLYFVIQQRKIYTLHCFNFNLN